MITALLVTAITLHATPSPEPRLIHEGYQFTEGPVWLADSGLIFSDIPADTVFHEDGKVFRKPSGKSNGLTVDAEGRLIACEHGNRRVTRTEKDGSIKILADTFEGKALNSPNDVAVHPNGRIYFTDPPYGLDGRAQELDFRGVYCFEQGRPLRAVARDMETPNGLAITPDGKRLYVGDSGKGYIMTFEFADDGSLVNGARFAELPTPDGMKIHPDGRLFVTAEDGVRVYSPEGVLLSTLVFPQQPSNCAFSPDAKTLYVTARTAVYALELVTPDSP